MSIFDTILSIGRRTAPEIVNAGRKVKILDGPGAGTYILGESADTLSKRAIKQGERLAESAFGKRNPVPSVMDVVSGSTKNRGILSRIPRKVKYGVPAIGAGFALVNLLSGKTEAPSDLDYSQINFGNQNNSQSVIDDFIRKQQEAITNAYSNMPTYGAPGAEMYNGLSGMVNQVGGASVAEMQKLAGLAAQQAGAIQAGGAQGAASINDIYGDVSGQLSDLASYGGEYGAMTPVSGAMATAPQEAVAQGQNLADYLRQNQMITSQDAGFLGGLAPMLGTGYANQLAMMDYAARQQAAIRQQQMNNQMAYERQQALQDALLETALMGNQLGLEQQLRNPAGSFVDPSTILSAEQMYNELSDEEKNLLKLQGINNVNDYVNLAISQSRQGA